MRVMLLGDLLHLTGKEFWNAHSSGFGHESGDRVWFIAEDWRYYLRTLCEELGVGHE